jgi:hypothetical protein
MEEVKRNPTRQRQCQGITVTIGAIIIGITIGSQCCTSPSHAGCCLPLTKNVTDSWAHKVFSANARACRTTDNLKDIRSDDAERTEHMNL